MSDRQLVRSQRAQNSNFDIVEIDGPPNEIYVDGFAGQAISAAVTKTDLFVIVGTREEEGVSIEERWAKWRIVMPTHALLEFCEKTLNTFKEHGSTLERALIAQQDQISKFLVSSESNGSEESSGDDA